jgi:hypothetical protein
MLLCAPITEMTQYLLWCQVSHPLDRKRRETRNQQRRGAHSFKFAKVLLLGGKKTT